MITIKQIKIKGYFGKGRVFEDDEIPYEVELAFDHDGIMRDAIKKYKEVVK